MKALKRLSAAPYDMKLIEIDDPALKAEDWIIVKVEYAGICSSDLENLARDCSGPVSLLRPPVVPGHETSGIVYKTGSNVTRLKTGDRVVNMNIVDNCMVCKYCHSGDWGACKQRKGLGSNIDGSFAEFIAMPSKNAFVLPDEIELDIAIMVEPLGCGVHIIQDMGKVKRGEKVLIFGPGAIGACSGITALANGADVIIVGTPRSKPRLDVCAKAGMKTITNDGNISEKIKEIWGDELIDVCVDSIGSEETFDFCANAVRVLGRIVVCAVPPGTQTINKHLLYWKQIQVCCARGTRPDNWVDAIDIIRSRTDIFRLLVSKIYKLEEWEEAFEVARNRDSFRVLLRP